MARAKQISRAGNGQGALAERTEALPLRTWDASDESLRNFTGKTHEKVTALNAVSPPSVCLSGLSQAPHPMHRRGLSFSASPMSGTGRMPLGRRRPKGQKTNKGKEGNKECS